MTFLRHPCGVTALMVHVNLMAIAREAPVLQRETPSPLSWNPLAGLPALPKTHHTYGGCLYRADVPAPSMACIFPVDADNAVQRDYARITHAWPLQLALGLAESVQRDTSGNVVFDPEVAQRSLNKTEIQEATKLCAATNASLTLNISPWNTFWGHGGDTIVEKRECPGGTFLLCDPDVRGPNEEAEVRFWTLMMRQVKIWVQETNQLLGSKVNIGGVLIDSERFFVSGQNSTRLAALARKHDLIVNVSRLVCAAESGCSIEQYNRGTIQRDTTESKASFQDGWGPWPGYPGCLGQGDTFATSLYQIPEISLMRETFKRTVANAKACGITHVTPWLWLGGGERRIVSAAAPHGGTHDDFTWDYDEPYSWMIGRELADPFYNSARFAPWQAARVVALFPNTFSTDSWTSIPPYQHKPGGPLSGCDAQCVVGHMQSSVTFRHFVAYVLGAANIPRLNSSTWQ